MTTLCITVAVKAENTNHLSMRKFILPGLVVAVLAAAFFLWQPLQSFYLSKVPAGVENQYVNIPTGSSFEDLVQILKTQRIIGDENAFRYAAAQMKFIKPVMRPGRFRIETGWNYRQLINHLRIGEQAPVKVVFNSTERLPEEIAGKAARFIEADSLEILNVMRDAAFLAQFNYTPETAISACIPNTYEMYWNTDGQAFFKRMVKEHDIFWSKNDRLSKAQALHLTPAEVYTLASIVERETNYQPERPTVAGVYLNRLRIGMKLQADPTCVFATRDFKTRRVTQVHTSFNSPYNTYMYHGLPPGPISVASIPSIDAVLNHDAHNFLYFCAKPDDSGTHAFAATLQGHNVNADKFRAWLRTQGR